MAKTLWVNAFTGERLDPAVLAGLRAKAHRAYQANAHIFEDERDALDGVRRGAGVRVGVGRDSARSMTARCR